MSPIIKIVALALAGALSYSFFTSAGSTDIKEKIRHMKGESKRFIPRDIPASSLKKEKEKQLEAIYDQVDEPNIPEILEVKTPVKTVPFDLNQRARSAQEKLISLSGGHSEKKIQVKYVEPMTSTEKQQLEQRRQSALQKQLDLVNDLLR